MSRHLVWFCLKILLYLCQPFTTRVFFLVRSLWQIKKTEVLFLPKVWRGIWFTEVLFLRLFSKTSEGIYSDSSVQSLWQRNWFWSTTGAFLDGIESNPSLPHKQIFLILLQRPFLFKSDHYTAWRKVNLISVTLRWDTILGMFFFSFTGNYNCRRHKTYAQLRAAVVSLSC